MTDLASVAKNFPQSAYSGLQKLLQQEWQIVQRVRKDTDMDFSKVERAISQSFLPALFSNAYDDDDPRRRLASLLVKHASLALPNPTESAESNYDASTLACSHLVAALKGVEVFSSSNHLAVIGEVRIELQPCKDAKHDSILASIVSTLSCGNRRTILRGQETGQWLLVMPSMVNGTQLLAQEYQDALLLCYARSPADLQSHCDGCRQKFSVRHALGCKKGGLVISFATNPVSIQVAPLNQCRNWTQISPSSATLTRTEAETKEMF
jgi:hypothetical protein